MSRSVGLPRRHHGSAQHTLLTEAQSLDGSTVHVRFDDGTTADIDLSYLLDYGGVFDPLRDPAYFMQLRANAEAGTIVWPNDADIAPETLYAQRAARSAHRRSTRSLVSPRDYPMSPDDIKHFLIVYDIPSAHADVRPYGTDYDAALEAYEQAEHDTRNGVAPVSWPVVGFSR
jgi:hypothetical protein